MRAEATRQLCPIYLDQDDLYALDQVQHDLWLKSRTDAFVQCLRVGAKQSKLKSARHKWKSFDREYNLSGRVVEEEAIYPQLTEWQIAELDAISDRLELNNRTKTVRLVIRVGADHFGSNGN